jgi:hypothetical protein
VPWKFARNDCGNVGVEGFIVVIKWFTFESNDIFMHFSSKSLFLEFAIVNLHIFC